MAKGRKKKLSFYEELLKKQEDVSEYCDISDVGFEAGEIRKSIKSARKKNNVKFKNKSDVMNFNHILWGRFNETSE